MMIRIFRWKSGLLIIVLCALSTLVSCSQSKPDPTFPPEPTIIPKTKAPDSLNADPAVGVALDVTIGGYVERKEHGLGSVIEYQDYYFVSYVPVDKTYLFDIRLPKNFLAGTYPIQQHIYVNKNNFYVLQPDDVGAMFMFIHEEDRSYDDIVFDRGTYFGSNVNGSITITSLKPFAGTVSFSGQDDQKETISISGHFTGA